MIASIVLVKQLTYNKESMCANNILIGNDQYNYCAKSKNLNNQKIVNEIFFQQYSNSQLFMNTDSTQKSVIDIQVYNYNVNVFVLFGLVGASQNVVDSKINISLNFPVFQGALICVQCDVYVTNCTLVFIATGKAISCVLIEARSVILIQQTFIQFRISSFNSSGIANKVNHASVIFSITDCKLTGSNLLQSGFNGYISCQVLVPISVVISSFFVCVGNTSNIGNESEIVSFTGAEIDQCDLCDTQFVVYGLCLDSLKYGTQVGNVLECYYPFIFQDIQCTCDQGYVLDSKKCVNILQALRNVTSTETGTLSNRIDDIATELLNVDARISNNASSLQTQIINTQSELESQMSASVSQLTNIMFNNVAALENNILGNASILIDQVNLTQGTLENYIIANATVLDWRIYNNISVLNYSLMNINQIIQLNVSDIQYNFSVLDSIITIFKQDQSKIVSNIQSKYLLQVSQLNAELIDLINEINCNNVVGQVYINSTCQNVSCSASGQQRVNGVCECSDANAIVQDNSCVCPLYSILIGSVCMCPINSNIVNGVCVCDVIGQYVDNGVCVCPIGKANIYDICQDIYTVLELQCSQVIFIAVIDTTTITHSVSLGDFIYSGYVFNTTNIISNAFINLNDNIYLAAKPLFQSQISFTNIKIQIGTQYISGGQLLIPMGPTITINQMNIFSKLSTSISITSSFCIITSYSSNTLINNLVVNLNFKISTGGIYLLQSTSGVFNITQYQVLGNYQTNVNAAMICSSSSAKINIDQINFKPSIYTTGPFASYLFCSASDTLVVKNVAIILGNNSNLQILARIPSTIGNQHIFGGVICQLTGTNQLYITNVIIDSYQQLNTSYVGKFGLIVGNIQSILVRLKITNVCIQQQLLSYGLQTNQIGLVGYNTGIISLQQLNLKIQIQGSKLFCYGIIGQQSASTSSEITDVKIILDSSSDASSNTTGAIFGDFQGKNGTISNAIVISKNNVSIQAYIGGFVGNIVTANIYILNSTLLNSLTQCQKYVGGFIGASSGTILIQNSTVSLSIISGGNNVGGFIGYMNNVTTIKNSSITDCEVNGSEQVAGLVGFAVNCQILLNDIKIFQVKVAALMNIGIFLGQYGTGNNLISTNSSSNMNQINGVMQADCANLNSSSQSGC
ncbi:Hypothetical_protein [Hexamita inflata]|uniref:Hypothetical_protein n=1 Tax=Hexamita inflata TaxID=28002 RepID=A0AA86U4X0_9EUKA|nr:Hypothetical protein HINF_LOCUS30420 [Hexamita inflata]